MSGMALKLLLAVKGGAGSGNFGHAGVPGHIGGSSPKGGSITSSKPSLSDFINIYKIEQFGKNLSKPIFNSLEELPASESGKIRFLHGTALDNLASIDKKGVLTGKEVQSKEHLSEVLGYSDSEYKRQGGNVFGEITIVADVPGSEVNAPNSGWLSINRAIKPEEIKGYLVGKITVNPSELMPIINAYKERYG